MNLPYIIYTLALFTTASTTIFYPRPKTAQHKKFASCIAWALASGCIISMMRSMQEVFWIDTAYAALLCFIVVRHNGNIARLLKL